MIAGADRGQLVTVDTGLVRSGVAVWINGELAHVAAPRGVSGGDIALRCACMANAIAVEAATIAPGAATWAIEWPAIYPGGRTKNPSSLFGPAGIAAGVAALAPSSSTIVSVLPRDWKGTIPKPRRRSDPYIVESRVRAALSGSEAAVLEQAGNLPHDAFDALGLGLWVLGRAFRRSPRGGS